MARKDQEQGSYLSAQRGFLNAPSSKSAPPPPNFFRKFINEEILHPEKRPGNLAIAWAATFFGAAVIFTRTFGKEALVPMF